MKIVVLAGGLSPERDVSLTSGTEICNALRRRGHAAILVNLFYGVKANCDADLQALFEDASAEITTPNIGIDTPNINEVKAARKLDENDWVLKDAEIGPNVLCVCKMADIVFMGLHGGIGENGKLAALFDVYGIKYTGTGSLSSSLAMHKGIAKEIFVASNVPAARYELFKSGDDTSFKNTGLELPVVVKVCSGGSSIGVFIAHTEAEYNASIEKCFAMEADVLVEEFVQGREFAVPVLDGKALPVIEIIPENGWFDYKHKYQANQTREVCPAQIDGETTSKLQEAAERAYRCLGLQVYARPDFIVSESGDIYCIEINTLPGMTPASLFPKSANAAGIKYDELCEKILQLSLNKYN